ncbi:MAG: molybdate ABC transporter substrate-binding protein [Rhodobacterales bacterium]|nr:MAG: molybdate ABC transporter substrate-binding protein [Rhodobacterales bacterium]
MTTLAHPAKLIIAVLLLFMPVRMAIAGEATVAVASNFLHTATKIAESFTAQTGHQLQLVNGSTGALFAQISHGAPYDLFLSADQLRVLRLAQEGRLLNGQHKTYALGKLVLYARDPAHLQGDLERSLRNDAIRHVALADARTAPYGSAAHQVLERLNLSDLIRQKAVIGANVAQSFGFVATGNAQIGFVALSQAKQAKGGWIAVSEALYVPIVQEVGVLKNAAGNPAAQEFYEFLSSETALHILQESGYGGAQ